MIYQGTAITVRLIEDNLAHLLIDLQGESVNKFNALMSSEFGQALAAIEQQENLRGLLISSGKEAFIVGADVLEFGPAFKQGAAAITQLLKTTTDHFNRLEDLPFPTVVAINGYALGGGFELCLACDFRVASASAKVGLPETKLGILPGWGGTVRLPRLVGLDTAIEWIAAGTEHPAASAMSAGVLDGVVEPEQLEAAALAVLQRAAAGKLDYQARRQQKKSPLRHNQVEGMLAFESSKLFVKAQAGKHYPAPVTAVETMQKAAMSSRSDALKAEARSFVKLAQTPVAKNLVGLFLNDQYIGKKAKGWAKQVQQPVKRAAVLGAGIMGGGIAYQSASRGIPVKLKDVQQRGLDLGQGEAARLLSRRVAKGRITVETMAETLVRIEPTLEYDGFSAVDIVIEAVVEKAEVKAAVLAEVEQRVSAETVLCSNTSTISIDTLSEGLQRPENFCGLHFFNPVHAMPLVEVVRGGKTSDATIGRAVAYALALGKKPVVVNNCAGFLVNRVLFPYLAGFTSLIRDGADFTAVDKTMERFGWPMGPAYLLDVVGLDVATHAEAVLAAAYPDRMGRDYRTATDLLLEAGRLGQKNGQGFYDYQLDRRGKQQKQASDQIAALLAGHVEPERPFSDEEIVTRMMIPMANELVRCLEEGIVASPAEADMALVYGLGFPPFRGGVFRWLEELGLQAFVTLAQNHSHLGPLYQVTDGLQQMAAAGKTYYATQGADA